MKDSSQIIKICIKMTIATLAISASLITNAYSNPAAEVHGYCDQANHNHVVLNERQARRVVRNFLSSRGYTKRIAPGGAHIRTVQDEGSYYKTLVVLRESSAADTEKHWLYVDKIDHSISEHVLAKTEIIAKN